MVGFAKLFAAYITGVLVLVRCSVAQPHVFVQVSLAVEVRVALKWKLMKV